MATEVKPLLDRLFRRESAKLISVLTRTFGPHNLELAEDVVQDTLLKALEYWKFHGTPENPSAWLFTVARNKALDVIRRERHHKEFAAGISSFLKSEYSVGGTLRELVQENEIEDEQLRMMFICCHPSVPEEGQVALILKTLCGFSVAEIANAFFTHSETISKRLYRARKQFREEQVAFALPAAGELQSRLGNVLTAVYLIFNEGYNTFNHHTPIREDLVEEALRLTKMLVDHPLTRQPASLALMALLCFQSSRLNGRVDAEGNLLQLRDQNRELWNEALIRQGEFYLQHASEGERLSPYHLEAAIAYEHCRAKSYAQTNWTQILKLYNWLLEIKPDALIALNRLIAFAEVHGPRASLEEAEHLHDKELLKNYYVYPAALGEWYAMTGDRDQARKYFEEAIQLTQSRAEKEFLKGKIGKISS